MKMTNKIYLLPDNFVYFLYFIFLFYVFVSNFPFLFEHVERAPTGSFQTEPLAGNSSSDYKKLWIQRKQATETCRKYWYPNSESVSLLLDNLLFKGTFRVLFNSAHYLDLLL